MFRSGFVAIIGRPNAGKSTLLNAILGEKVSIVSSKPQTTRNVVKGVKNLADCQIVFLDTPGIHRAKGGLLNRFMVREALSSIEDADAIVYLVDGLKPSTDDDAYIIEGLKKARPPVILCINKVDVLNKESLLPLIERFSKGMGFKEIIPISALKADGVDALLKAVSALLPEGPKYFPDDTVTDQPERFIAAEFVREKIFNFIKEEVPYSVAVVIDVFKEKKGLVSITATINVERESQKAIVIGKGGAMIKRIGTAAREDLEKVLGSRVFLELFVRVQEDWTGREANLKEFGY